MSNVLSVTGAAALLAASILVTPGHADARPAVIYRAGRALCYYSFGWHGPGYYPCSRLHFAKPAHVPRIAHYPVHVRVRAAHGGEIRWHRIRVGRGHDHGGGHHGHGGDHPMAGGGHPHRMGGGYAGAPAHAERFGTPPMRGSTHGGYTGGLGFPRETPVRGAPLGDGRIGRAPAAGMHMSAPIVGAPVGGGMHVGAPMGGAPMGGGMRTGAPMGGAPMGGGMRTGAPMGGTPMGGGMHMGAPMSGAPMGGGMHMGTPAAAPAAAPAMHAPAAAPAPAAPPATHH